MKRAVAGLAAVALFAPASARAVTPGSTYDFCGGTGFTFCASVAMSVAASSAGYTVTLDVLNRSLAAGLSPAAQFVSIGLENVLPTGETLSSPSNFRLQQGTWNGMGYTFADVCGANPTCWNMATNKHEGGGVNVDFDASTALGNQVSIASNCLATDPHWNEDPINTCGQGANSALWRPVRISFDVVQNVVSADLYVKAIADGSTECLTGSRDHPCTMIPVTTTPEPATMMLFGSGLLALSGAARSRRRKDAGSSPAE